MVNLLTAEDKFSQFEKNRKLIKRTLVIIHKIINSMYEIKWAMVFLEFSSYTLCLIYFTKPMFLYTFFSTCHKMIVGMTHTLISNWTKTL